MSAAPTRDRRADVLRAFDRLHADPEDHALRDDIARLLGMEWTPARAKPISSPADGATPIAPVVAPSLRPVPGRTSRSVATEPPVERAPSAEPEPFHLRQIEKPERRPPQWLEHVRALPRASVAAAKPSAVAPLLDPLQSRSILSGALARHLADGPLDIQRVIDRIGRGEAIVEIPRLPQPTIARGVQLLIDRGEAMLPYAADLVWMHAALEKVVGRYALEVLQFADSPMRGAGRKSRRTWKPYAELTPPRRGATIVALTDLGIRRLPPPAAPASDDEWIRFATFLDRFRCPLIALVPYGPRRWPGRLRKRFAIVEWDRSTSAGKVRSTLAHGLP